LNILFITDNFPPETNAPATRTFEHCKEWIAKGVEVTIITCVPNFPYGKVYEGYKNKLYQKETIEGIEVIRVWSYMSFNSGFLKRILDYVSFSFSSFVAGLFQKSDVIIATSPQFFITWSACALSFLKRTPWIFELRDIWPESIRTVGAVNHDGLINTLEKVELFLYRNSNKVIAVTDAFKTNLMGRGIAAEKIDVVTNGSNMELFSPRPKDDALLASLGLSGKFIVGYIGTHGLAHSLDFIVKSLSKISDPDIHFLFIGDGAMKKKIQTIAEELKLNNVSFLNPVTKEDVPKYLSCVDVSLAPLKKEDNFKTVIPSKIFEASAMQKPTLLGVQGQAQEIVEKYDAGLCFEPENEVDFITKLLELKNNTERYKQYQLGCSKLAKAYDRKKLANKMLNIIQDVVDGRK